MSDEFLRNNSFVLHKFRHTERYEYKHWVDHSTDVSMVTVLYSGIKIDFYRSDVSRYWLIKPTMTATDRVDIKKLMDSGMKASTRCKDLITENYYPRAWMDHFIDEYDNELTLID
jgi:hypothetical protein